MMILGGRITKMEAKRLEDNAVDGISLNINVKSVTNEKKIVKIDYESKIEYSPGVAELNVAGELVIEEEGEKQAKDAVEDFRKNKQLPEKLAEEVITAVNYSTTSVGTLMAFGIGLGAPINVPRARLVKQPADSKTQAS